MTPQEMARFNHERYPNVLLFADYVGAKPKRPSSKGSSVGLGGTVLGVFAALAALFALRRV